MGQTENKTTKSLEEALTLYIEENTDMVHMELVGDTNISSFYLSSLIEQEHFERRIEDKFYRYTPEQFKNYLHSISSSIKTVSSLYQHISSGAVILYYQEQFIAVDIGITKKGRDVNLSESEATIIGPMEGFVENIEINMNLMRQRYPKESLCIENIQFQKEQFHTVYALYDKEKVDPKHLKTFLERIVTVDMDWENSTTKIAHALYKQRVILFPRELSTERPDRVCRYLAKGKIVIFINGDPFALALAMPFHEFLTAQDDFRVYTVPHVFLMILRYCSFVLSMVLPALYVASTAYNPEVFKVQLALSVASSRQGIPFPSFLEVTFMLLLMELLIEGSLRLPRTIGPAATTVGGLILGQAATQAHLVSDIMIIVVASVAITNFVIPVTIMTVSSRLLKYFLLVFAALGGMYGVFIGTMIMLIYLFSIESIGVNYIQLTNLVPKSLKVLFKGGKKSG